jgi:hypothetical protein
MSGRTIIFSHGKDGDPWGSKIVAMAEVAQAAGYQVESVDYRGMDDPQARVSKLVEFAKHFATPVLVGSSLGGHVSTAAAHLLKPRGLFLLAPAFYMPGFEEYTPRAPACPISIVHGWQDDIVPVQNSLRYAREYQATLQVINADHQMLEHIPYIVAYFNLFLQRLP